MPKMRYWQLANLWVCEQGVDKLIVDKCPLIASILTESGHVPLSLKSNEAGVGLFNLKK
jgi:hypothetical protein